MQNVKTNIFCLFCAHLEDGIWFRGNRQNLITQMVYVQSQRSIIWKMRIGRDGLIHKIYLVIITPNDLYIIWCGIKSFLWKKFWEGWPLLKKFLHEKVWSWPLKIYLLLKSAKKIFFPSFEYSLYKHKFLNWDVFLICLSFCAMWILVPIKVMFFGFSWMTFFY